jgi:hypothetical protein
MHLERERETERRGDVDIYMYVCMYVRGTQSWRSPCQLCGKLVGSNIMLYKDKPTSSYANYHVNLITSAVRGTRLIYRIYVDSKTAFSESTLNIGNELIDWELV